jgi:hypothetical protein
MEGFVLTYPEWKERQARRERGEFWAYVVLAVLAIGMVVAFSCGATASQPKVMFPDWQLVMDTQAGCFKRGDAVILRTNDGTKISTVARLKVAHVDGRSGVVTFVERQP